MRKITVGAGLAVSVLFALGLGISGASAATSPLGGVTRQSSASCPGVTVTSPANGDQLSATAAGVPANSPLLAKANAAHVHWLTNVSCAPAVTRDHRERRGGPGQVGTQFGASSASSYNWSGYQTDQPNANYVDSEWYQPSVSLPAGTSDAYSSMWPGIGGVGGQPLIQAGTEADVHSGIPGQTNYFWYEVWTADSSRQTPVSSLYLQPGDDVGAAVTYNQISNSASFIIVDFTSGDSADFSAASPHPGGTAEWIMERTQENGAYPTLANYGTAHFISGYFNTSTNSGGAMTPQQGNAYPVTMTGDGGVAISTPSALGANNAPQFTTTWHSPGH